MVKTEKLDRELWENHKVIVSPAFLESIKDAYENRKNKPITIKDIREMFQPHEFPPEETPEIPPSCEFPSEETPLSCEFPPEIQGDNTQTKLKETKLNKNKEKESKEKTETDDSNPEKLFLHH